MSEATLEKLQNGKKQLSLLYIGSSQDYRRFWVIFRLKSLTALK
jgi:hypothetical protein